STCAPFAAPAASSSCANSGSATTAAARNIHTKRFIENTPILMSLAAPVHAPYRAGLHGFFGALLGRPRRARDGADHGPVVLVHGHRALRLRPQLDGEVIVAVAEDARLDGQVAHALRSEEHTSELQSLRHLVCR